MNGSLRIVGLLPPAGQVISVAIALSATVLLSACALPVEGLWPTSPDSPARTIFVSLDTWHAMIAFSESEQPQRVTSKRTLRRGFPLLRAISYRPYAIRSS